MNRRVAPKRRRFLFAAARVSPSDWSGRRAPQRSRRRAKDGRLGRAIVEGTGITTEYMTIMTPVSPSADASKTVAEQIQGFFGEHRSDLVRFASIQLRDPAMADDVVQETLIAVLKGHREFANRSSVKTWVFSILKRKIIDALRVRQREVPISQLGGNDEEHDGFDALFDQRGFWATQHRPHRWADPDDSLEQQQFWRVFELCLDHLPERTSRVFMMREFLELDTEEICQELAISPSNCWVILHRARMGLRLCLEETWFNR